MRGGVRNIRVSIIAAATGLLAFGLVMVYSSSAIYAMDKFGDASFFLKRHALYIVVGAAVTVFVMSRDIAAIRRAAMPMLFVVIGLLVIVLIPGIGRAAGGARRWLEVGPLRFQPVELAKFALIIYLADFLQRKRLWIRSLKFGFLPSMVIIGGIAGLILLQPDLGSCVALASVGLIMLFSAGARLKHLAIVIVTGALLLTGAIASMPYRRARIMAYVDPWKDPKGSGFQIIQSLIALGSGGPYGIGLGESRQKLFYLPESHTDFIFSIIGEEMGLMGTSGVTLLFGMIVWQGIRIGFKKNEPFSRSVAVGVSCLFGLEAAINIGVSTGLLPTKGLPLPLVSYGGTSLVLHMAMLGLLLNVGRDTVA